jgi:hypothetical protein
MRVGSVRIAIDPASLNKDKVVLQSIVITAPEVNLEGGLRSNNLTQIQSNILGFLGTDSGKAGGGNETRLQVDELVITGARVTATTPVTLEQPVAVPLPDIRLSQLGQGPEGITPADLAARIMDALVSQSIGSVGSSISKLGGDVAKGLLDNALQLGGEAGKALKGVTELFKRRDQ